MASFGIPGEWRVLQPLHTAHTVSKPVHASIVLMEGKLLVGQMHEQTDVCGTHVLLIPY